MRFYWSDNSEVEQALASGEIVAGWGWNDTYARLKAEGVPVAFGVPKEGIRTWVCGLVMHSETEHADAAYDLINAMTSPEAGAYIITEWGFGHSNRKAFEEVDAETLQAQGLSTPDVFLSEGVMYNPMDPVIEHEYYELFESVKAGA